jgi:peptidoglycan/LPS O-acetylase OafA/YrhL
LFGDRLRNPSAPPAHVERVRAPIATVDAIAPDRSGGPGRRLETLEIGRGIAATMVALSHAVGLIAEPRWFGVVLDRRLAAFNVGVDFFFVLSGFIVTFVHWPDIGQPGRLGHYAARRFARVFPPYWVVLSAIVPVYLAVPSFGEPRQHDWRYIVSSYLLFPMPEQPVLGVAWTLTFELFFYVLLGLVVRFGWRLLPLFALWGAGIVVCQAGGLADRYPLSFLGSAYGLQFLLGMALAGLLRTRRAAVPGALLALGLVGFVGPLALLPDLQQVADGVVARLVFGAAAGLIIAGAVELERTGRLRAPALLVPLGAATYAIYLTHVVTESATIRVTRTLAPGIGPGAMLGLLAVVAVVGGLAFHRAIERPLTGAVRRALS